MFLRPGNRNTSINTKPNTCIRGNITGKGIVKMNGNVDGDIEINGTVIIGKHGNIKGNIVSDNVELYGRIEGNITAKNNLKLFSTAQLYGDASTRNFKSATGAVFVGNCIILDDEPERINGQSSKIVIAGQEEKEEISKVAPGEKSPDDLAVNQLDSSVKGAEDSIKEKEPVDSSISVQGKEIEMEPAPAPAIEIEIEMEEKEKEKEIPGEISSETSGESRKKFIIKKYN